MIAAELTGDDLLAAEYALGLVEGEDLLAARARLTRDSTFADKVSWWEERFAPLLDEYGGARPDPDLWGRIEQASADEDVGREVIQLRRRLRLWRGATGLLAAASLAALMLAALPIVRGPLENARPVETPGAPPLFASIPIADTPLRLAVTYLPERREILLSAAGLTADGVHDHELWLVPDRGALRSLGVVKPGAAIRVPLESETAALIHAGSRMLLTREPLGGKPAAAAAGPVVAEGSFEQT